MINNKVDRSSDANNLPPIIPASLHSLPIGILHLSKRTYNSLQKAGTKTVGSLFELAPVELLEIPGLGSVSVEQINEIKDAFLYSVEGSEINWSQYWNKLKISLLPKEIDSNVSSEDFCSLLGRVIKDILVRNSDKRVWPIVQRRFGLEGVNSLTLQELGIVFGLSRERVRQIEDRALEELQDVLIEDRYFDRDYHVQPKLSHMVRGLLRIVKEITIDYILEDELLDYIYQQSSIDFGQQKSILYLILKIGGMEQTEFDDSNLEPFWSYCDKKQRKQIKQGVERLNSLLTKETPQAMSKIDILLSLNRRVRKNKRLSMEQLLDLIQLCRSSIEELGEGRYWGKFECLRGRGNQVERILIERGEPTHIAEITREINHRLSMCGKRIVGQDNLVNQISVNDKFIPIGRSGEWALTSWAHIDTSTIVELMERCLVVNNKPITADEIYTYVSARRSVNRNSIGVYLATLDHFVHIDEDTWGLASWVEAKNTTVWNPEQVARFVEAIFKENRTEDLPFATIRDALMQASELSIRQANGKLNVNPVIETRKDPNTAELRAIFQPNYKALIAKTKTVFNRKNKTLWQQLAEVVREQLERAPGKQMALSDLIDMLKDKFKQKTIYRYISEFTFVEKYIIPDTNVIVCRLKYDQETPPFSQVSDIVSLVLRRKVGRCLSFLNENDVDIALFLLSKEFEETMKSYLTFAHSKGMFPSLPKGRLSLDLMINFIKKEGLITDQAVLHFLRQKRNDRAHGTMPSVEERRIMMKYSEVTAEMYIDYIKFFDDLRQALK